MYQPVSAARYVITQREQTRRWWRIEIQITIGVILYHQGAGANGQLKDALTTCKRQCCPTWVAEVGIT